MAQDDPRRHIVARAGLAASAIARSIRMNSEVEAETRLVIARSRKLLDDTAHLVQGDKPLGSKAR
jgi:hypothetical protein